MATNLLMIVSYNVPIVTVAVLLFYSNLFVEAQAVFILGILRGEYSPQKSYSPQKIPSYQAKVSYFCSEKLSASGGAPQTSRTGALPLDPAEE